MEVMLRVLLFSAGICAVSYLNVIIYRLPLHISTIWGRSYCPNCHHKLYFCDTIPILSYIVLRGRCRYCGKKISRQYIFIETLGMLYMFFCMMYFDDFYDRIIYFIYGLVLLGIACIDIKYMVIPNRLNIALLFLALLLSFYHTDISFKNRLIAACMFALPMLLFNIACFECFGGGDIKLIAAAGYLLGIAHICEAVFIALILGGCYAMYLLLYKEGKRKDRIAFGPFLCLGILIAIYSGTQIINLYLML